MDLFCVVLVLCTPEHKLTCFWQKAEEIFSFLLDHFKANPNPVSDAQLIQGSTTLTYAIVNAYPCAVRLIQEDMGVFDLDGAKRSPLFWADRQHDKRLESQLKARYKAKCRRLWPSSSMQTLE